MSNSIDISKIHETIEWSQKTLERNRKDRKDAIAQFVGSHYSDNGSKKNVPTNMLEMAITIYTRLLAAHSPHCSVTCEDFNLKPFANSLEIVLNQIPREIGLQDTIRRAVLEAMFSIGVVKVGIAGTNPNPKIGDEPFVSLVQIDDYFVDMSARSWDEVQYEGNEYWMTTEEIKKIYGVEIAGEGYNGQNTRGDEQANSVTSGEARQSLYEKVLLRDVYLPLTNELVTYSVRNVEELRRVPWDGPEGSPYIKLGFTQVPGNLMPLAPSMLWRDLHDLGNQLYRKLANQATNKKTVAVFQGGTDEEISRFKAASDGTAVRFNGAEPKAITVGGVDNQNLAFFLSNWDRFSMLCGNLDSLGGLSAQSSTAKQDALISEAASARVKDMSDKTVDFVNKIFRRLAWYVWTDPVRRRNYYKGANSKYGLSLKLEWTPETRDGDFLDYNFNVAAYSMQDDSPATRVEKVMQLMTSLILPMQQQLSAQGAVIDFNALLDYIAKNANMPELKDLVKSQGMVPQQPNQAAGLPQPEYISTKAPVTKRTYERISRGGGTRQGRDAALVQTLMGAGINDGQAAQMAGGVR